MVGHAARGERLTAATRDTICAIATPPGAGGIGIVRVSGTATALLAHAVLGRLPPPRLATFTPFKDSQGTVVDNGLALYFPAPASFTGEDVLELHAHGSAVVLDILLRTLVGHGARIARPGEFSERAFLNGKIDLLQAEAIADLIASATDEAAAAACRTLQGAFSQAVGEIGAALMALRTRIEARLDFPDEDLGGGDDQAVAAALAHLIVLVRGVRDRAQEGRLLQDGREVVILGRPNAGKSTLLNVLSGQDAAIVSAQPGTTRDLLRETINLEGLPLRLTDTAGLRATDDMVEREGIRRAEVAAAHADGVLLLVDDTTGERPTLPVSPPVLLVVHTKIDCSGRRPGVTADGVAVSALTGSGIPELRQLLAARLRGPVPREGLFSARRRHLAALAQLEASLCAAQPHLAAQALELAAEELRCGQLHLSTLTGAVTSDDLLGEIFASFCIGK